MEIPDRFNVYDKYPRAMVYQRDGSYIIIHPNFYDIVRTEWLGGKTFVDAKLCHGGKTTIKLAEVNCINWIDVEAMEILDEELQRSKLES